MIVVLLLSLINTPVGVLLDFAVLIGCICRKAKLPKNLVYVERYKQASLFQDVLGKHNGCKVRNVKHQNLSTLKPAALLVQRWWRYGGIPRISCFVVASLMP